MNTLHKIQQVKQIISKLDFLQLIDFDDEHIVRCLEAGHELRDVDAMSYYKHIYSYARRYYSNLTSYIDDKEDLMELSEEIRQRVERVKLYLKREPLVIKLHNLKENTEIKVKRLKI